MLLIRCYIYTPSHSWGLTGWCFPTRLITWATQTAVRGPHVAQKHHQGGPLCDRLRNAECIVSSSLKQNDYRISHVGQWSSTGGSLAKSSTPIDPTRPMTGFPNKHQIIILDIDVIFILFYLSVRPPGSLSRKILALQQIELVTPIQVGCHADLINICQTRFSPCNEHV